MRRVVGAGVMVIGLGAADLSYLLLRGHATPDSSVTTLSLVDSLPVPVWGARRVSREQESSRRVPVKTRSATYSVPPSFQRDPLVFLSTAPADSLELLPGIGPVLASRLLAARRGRGSFTSWDDVLRVRGIGPKTIERLQALASHR
jgi:DNA uptake protein ComE-like DNA-binding protein